MTQINLEFNVESASLVELRNQFKELRKAMAEATDPADMARLAAQAGEVRDKMKDMNESVAEFAAGSDFEKVNNNISGIKAGLADLDFGKVSQSVTNLATNVKKVDVKSLTNGVGDMTKAFGVLGKSLLTNPLFLIGGLVAVIVIILNKLGVFKKLFEDIGKFADQVWKGVEKVAEKLGLVEKKETEYQKRQRARLEASSKAQQEERKAIVETASGYVNLIYQLKATNANSAKRKELIGQINKQYGTTLKNLSDETAFQNQLNVSVKEYIALATLKVRMQQKEKEQEKAVQALIKAEDNLNKLKKEYNGMSEKEIHDYDMKTYGVSVYTDALTKSNFELERAQKKAESYAISAADIQAEIDKLGGSVTPNIAQATDGVDKMAELNKKYIDDLLKRNEDEEDLLRQILEKRIDLMAEGAEKERADRKAAFDEEQKQILDRSIQAEIQALNAQFAEKKITQEEYDKQLLEIRTTALQNLTANEAELLRLANEQLNRDLLKIDEDAANARTLAQLELQKASAKTLAEQKGVEIEIARETARQAIEAEGVTEEQKLAIRREAINTIAQLEEDRQSILTAAAETERQTAALIAKNQVDNAKADLDAAEEATTEKIQLLEIYQTAVTAQLELERNARLSALDEELAMLQKRNEAAQAGTGPAISEAEIARIRQIEEEKKAIQDEFRRQKLDLDKAAEDEIAKLQEDKASKVIEDIGKYAAGVGEALTMLSDIQNNLLEVEKTRLAEKHQQQLEGIDEESEEYAALKKQQAVEEEALQKKIFEANKKQQIASAIVQGVQSVLNAYSSGVAIPVVGPVMGPIFAGMAALVAATNVQKIKSQQFEGGGSGGGSMGSTPDIAGMSESAAAPIVNLFGQGNNANTETFTQPTTGGNQVISVVATVSESELSAIQQRVALMNRNAEL